MGIGSFLKEKVLPTAAVAAGTYFGGPAGGAAAGSMVSGLMGASAQPEQSKSGFYAMPQEYQQAYLQGYLPGAMNWYNQGPNQYQQSAMASLGGGAQALQDEIPGYMNPYTQSVTNNVMQQMRENAQMERDRIMARAGSNGLGGLMGDAYAKELGMLNDKTQGNMTQYADWSAQQGFNQAYNMRQQSLKDMLAAGDMPYEHISRLGGLLQKFPASENKMGAYQPSNWADKIGGSATTLANLYQNYQNTPQWHGGGGVGY